MGAIFQSLGRTVIAGLVILVVIILIASGVIVAGMQGYLGSALLLTKGVHAIGIGMWLGLIMAFNVWFIIWPNQKKALGIVTVPAEDKAAAARLAMLTS